MSLRVPAPPWEELQRRAARWQAAVGLAAGAGLTGFLILALELPRPASGFLVAAAAAAALVAGLLRAGGDLRRYAPLRHWSEACRRGDVSVAQERDALVILLEAPAASFGPNLLGWMGASAALGASLRFAPGGAPPDAFGLVLAAGTAVGVVSSALAALLLKRAVEPACLALAQGLPAAEVATPRRTSLVRKSVVCACGLALAAGTLAAVHGEARTRRALERSAAQLQSHLLARLAERLPDEGFEVLQRLGREAVALGVAGRVRMLEPGDAELEARLARAGFDAAPGHAGNLADAEELLTWRRLPDGRVLVASSPRDAWRGAIWADRGLIALLLVFCVAVAGLVAALLADDVSRAVASLRRAVERLADGDLASSPRLETDDEVGELAAALAEAVEGLRNGLGPLLAQAVRFEAVAREASAALEATPALDPEVAEALGQALRTLQEGETGGQASLAAARQLAACADESLASVFELGTSGEQLRQTASLLSSKVDDVSSSMGEAARSVTQVSDSATLLAQAATGTSASMAQMVRSMRDVDGNAGEMTRLSAHMVQLAEQGRTQVRDTISGMEAIREATDAAQRVIRSLGERAREIGSVLDVIDDVADETNLLALNAAIIASQAGEHGRAFSVVAEEIKALADRVLASTQEIGTLIRAVQEETGNAVGAIESGSESVLGGVDLVAHAGVSLEQITRGARESGERIGEIVAAVREQTGAAAHVAELVERVRVGVEQIRSAAREQARGHELVVEGTETMREVAEQVRRTTEEQVRGSGHIGRSLESVREGAERTQRTLAQQLEVSRRVSRLLATACGEVGRGHAGWRSSREALQRLAREAEALRRATCSVRLGVEPGGSDGERDGR